MVGDDELEIENDFKYCGVSPFYFFKGKLIAVGITLENNQERLFNFIKSLKNKFPNWKSNWEIF